MFNIPLRLSDQFIKTTVAIFRCIIFFLDAQEIGCFTDESPNHALTFLLTYRGNGGIPWDDWKVVRGCSEEAKKRK